MTQGTLRAGQVIDDRFVLRRRLGAGASGVVWAADDRRRGGEVALKILHPQLGGEHSLVAQLAREAKVLERLDHPNIAKALTFSSSGPFAYMAMELLHGRPLHEVIGRHTRSETFFPPRALGRLMEQICEGVAHAHAEGIIHRDLKPMNVIVLERGGRMDAKVLDFGIARLSEASLFDATTFGRRMGSLFYMSPEQTRGEPADARSDVFALGAMLFEMLTLRRAWAWGADGQPLPAFGQAVPHSESNSLAAVFTRIAGPQRPQPTVVRPELPPVFDAIVGRALAVRPADRYPSVTAFGREARAALDALTTEIEAATAATLDGNEPVARPASKMSEESAAATHAAPPADFEESVITDRRAAPGFVDGDQPSADIARPRIPKPLQPASPADPTIPFPSASARTAPDDGWGSDAVKTTLPPTQQMERSTRADEAPTAFLPQSEPREAAPGFAVGLEEAGPTVRDSRPLTALQPEASVVAPMDTGTTARLTPRRRVGLLLGLAAGAIAGTALMLSMSGGGDLPAPVRDVDPTAAVDIIPSPPPIPSAEVPHRELNALLKRVQQEPSDQDAFDALVKGILQAAARIEDPQEREAIQQIASLSSTVGNVEGLASCVRRLEASETGP